MNRSERRRLKNREDHDQKKIMAREEDIETIVKRAREDAIVQSWILMMAFPLLVLRDHYGFGKKRLAAFMKHVVTTYNDFQEHYFTLDDLIDVIRVEGGVDVKKLPDGLKVVSKQDK